MSDIRGYSAIDTLYEIKGFELASRLFEPLYLLVAAIVVGFGLVHLLYKASLDGRYRSVAFYIALALFLIWLVSPVPVRIALPAGYAYDATMKDLVRAGLRQEAHHSVRAPRFMAFTHRLVDWMSRAMIRSVDRTFETAPFAHDRAAVLLRLSKIHDDGLRGRYQGFVVWCYVRALAARAEKGQGPPEPYHDPFKVPHAEYRPFSIPGWGPEIDPTGYSGAGSPGAPDEPCEGLARSLFTSLNGHAASAGELEETRLVVRDALVKEGLLAPGSPSGGAQPVDLILRYMIYNETVGLLSASEVLDLQDALPDYEMFDRKTQTASNSQDLIDRFRSTVSWLVKVKQSVDQWIKHHAEGPALYYKVTCYAPGVYGLASMIVLAVFPFAGFGALFPGKWKALALWALLFLSVKLWMVFWSILSKFNQWRYSLADLGSDPSNGVGDQTYIFPAICLMYLVTPALSGIVVTLLWVGSKGAGGIVGNLAPSGGGGGIDVFGKLSDVADGGSGGMNAGAPGQAAAPEAAFARESREGGVEWNAGVPEGGPGPAGGGAPPAPPPPVPA